MARRPGTPAELPDCCGCHSEEVCAIITAALRSENWAGIGIIKRATEMVRLEALNTCNNRTSDPMTGTDLLERRFDLRAIGYADVATRFKQAACGHCVQRRH